MTNIYFLWKGGTPPSPYSLWMTGNGNYLRFTNSYAQFGTAGGSATHTHTSPTTTSGNSSTCGYYWSSGSGGTYQKVHTHSLTWSIGAANNDPSYYQYEVIYCDLTTWETNERSLPAGAVVLSDTALSWSALTRETAPDGKLIKLGTFGTTGGQENHTHSVSVTLNSTNPSQAGTPYASYSAVSTASHSHTGNLTTPGKSIKPARIQTRLYSVSAATDSAEAGIIAFMDGAPSANWTLVDWNDKFIESTDLNATSIGANTHDHTGLSLTSTSYTRSTTSTGGDSTSCACNTHTHNVNFSLSSADNSPPYVLLYPVKLNTTLYRVNTYDATYVEDLLLRKTCDGSVTATSALKKISEVPASSDALLQKTWEYGLLNDLLAKLVLEEAFGVDALLEKRDIPATAVFDAWVEKLNITRSAIFDLQSKKRDVQTSVDFDHILKKRNQSALVESDLLAKVRNRQVAYVQDIFSKKTKVSSWEMILRLAPITLDFGYSSDFLAEVTLDAGWQFDTVIRKQFVASSVLDLLACKGFTQTAAIDILTKRQNIQLGKAIDVWIKKFSLESAGTFDTYLLTFLHAPANMDVQVRTTLALIDVVDLILEKAFAQGFSIDALFRKPLSVTYTVDAPQKRGFISPLGMDILSRKSIGLGYTADYLGSLRTTVAHDITATLCRVNGEIICVMRTRFLSGRRNLGILMSALCFGCDEQGFRSDLILSGSPNEQRRLLELQSFTEPRVEVHQENFEYEPSDRKNRNITFTYR